MKILTIDESLKKTNIRYFKDSLKKEIVDNFKDKLKTFDMNVNQALINNENEEYYKGLINNFLRDNFYNDPKYNINTKGNIDSAIRENNNLICIIETKTPNNTNEMISKNNINRKAIWELILYYLDETRDCTSSRIKIRQNAQIKNLIATNSIDWFIFSSRVIEKIIEGEIENYYFQFKNGKFVSTKNEIMYQKIESELNSFNMDNIEFTYFNISNYYKNSDRDIGYLYKVFSRFYLLNDKYYSNKNVHVLNNKFYQELLYILGLSEYKKNGRKLIKIDKSITNSLAYQTYNRYVNHEDKTSEEAYDLTFESIIIWMDRLIFIKLFESQLINFNEDSKDYHILDNEKIKTLNDLDKLFFQVLGKTPLDRENSDFYNNYINIPYLNSALFERQEIERDGVSIDELENLPMLLKNDSILKNNSIEKLPLLEYIISFLNGYDFGLVSDDNQTTTKGKDIIDAAVLGLIFEKINGYKDGSVYTPSTITEFMAKSAVEYTIINTINNKMKWDCKDINDLIFNIKDNASLDLYNKLNDIINTITYCDPGCGSGHFLVSVLNRIIAVKYQLGILLNHQTGYPIRDYNIYVEDDVLIVEDAQGNLFNYNKSKIDSQQMQETLFFEKKKIIEKCIFGVDLNDKAVQICRLRLWIELLKNSFYKNGVMQTLPNIDINIKTGNSCISKIPFDVNSKDTLGKKLNINGHTKFISELKKLSEMYVSTDNKTIKKDIVRRLNEIDRAYIHPLPQLSFDEKKNIKENEEYKIYQNSLEWALQFPEILDNDGHFLGFDCIIGNPPYVGEDGNKNIFNPIKTTYLGKRFYTGKMDLLYFFFHLGLDLVKNNGMLCFITTNYYITADGAKKLRKDFKDRTTVKTIINFNEKRIFESAPGQHDMITFMTKNKLDESCSIWSFNTKGDLNYGDLQSLFDGTNNEAIFNSISNKDLYYGENNYLNIKNNYENDSVEGKIIEKMKRCPKVLSDVANIWQGVVPGAIKTTNDIFNKVNNENIQVGDGIFVLDENNARDKDFLDKLPEIEKDILKPYYKNSDINRYFCNNSNNKWLIYTTSKGIDKEKYPTIYSHLLKFEIPLKDRLIRYNESYDWTSLHRERDQKIFESEKVLIPYRSKQNNFAYCDIPWYFSTDCYCLIPKENNNIKYLLGLLNSKVYNTWFKSMGKTKGDMLEFMPTMLNEIPIIDLNDEDKKLVINHVEMILNGKDSLEYDDKINEILMKYFEKDD